MSTQLQIGWLAALAEAIRIKPAEIVLVGQARSGKTVLATMLTASGVVETMLEHQQVSDASIDANVHLIVLRQFGRENAIQASQALGAKVTVDELLALPRGQAVIRLAGETRVTLVDIGRHTSPSLFTA
jgi:hypothetical protein